MRILLVIILVLSLKLLAAQKVPVTGENNTEKQTLRVSWAERLEHSGVPNWQRLTQLFLENNDRNRPRIKDSIAKVISYDLIIYHDGNVTDSSIFHVVNTNFAKDYSYIAKKMISGTYVLITNIRCWVRWRNPKEFVYRPAEDEILAFRNL